MARFSRSAKFSAVSKPALNFLPEIVECLPKFSPLLLSKLLRPELCPPMLLLLLLLLISSPVKLWSIVFIFFPTSPVKFFGIFSFCDCIGRCLIPATDFDRSNVDQEKRNQSSATPNTSPQDGRSLALTVSNARINFTKCLGVESSNLGKMPRSMSCQTCAIAGPSGKPESNVNNTTPTLQQSVFFAYGMSLHISGEAKNFVPCIPFNVSPAEQNIAEPNRSISNAGRCSVLSSTHLYT